MQVPPLTWPRAALSGASRDTLNPTLLALACIPQLLFVAREASGMAPRLAVWAGLVAALLAASSSLRGTCTFKEIAGNVYR